MPGGGIEIALVEPFPWFDRHVDKLVLRPPTGGLFMRLGEPGFEVVAADGGRYRVEKDDVISAYISELLTFDGERKVDGGDSVFAVMGLADILQVRDALFSFFVAARAAILARNLTSSSSLSAASPPTSP